MTDEAEEYAKRFVTRAAGVHSAIAFDLADRGGILRCQECAEEQPLGDIAAYLRHGWPQHCGRTMLWVTQKLLDEESAAARGSESQS